MVNFDANEVIVIVFLGGTRGNFVRNCLTFSNNTADASLRTSNYNSMLDNYTESIVQSPIEIQQLPWGPGHAYNDELSNYDEKRFEHASFTERYILCGHLYQIPHKNTDNGILVESIDMFSNKKFVFITLTHDEICTFQKTTDNKWDAKEATIYCDFDYITQFVNGADWYNLPYKDILVKDKFLKHCRNIDKDCDIVEIENYYNLYHLACIINKPRMVDTQKDNVNTTTQNNDI